MNLLLLLLRGVPMNVLPLLGTEATGVASTNFSFCCVGRNELLAFGGWIEDAGGTKLVIFRSGTLSFIGTSGGFSVVIFLLLLTGGPCSTPRTRLAKFSEQRVSPKSAALGLTWTNMRVLQSPPAFEVN
nr:hypothetical protein Iba_chr10dCG9100 [Ipomoea batatas]